MWPTEQNRQAWDNRYGHLRRAAVRLPDAVRERLPDLNGKHVLHVPCGTGEVAAELIALGALVTGVDPSERALAEARERAPDAVFLQAELDELPLQFRRGRFNFVYAGEGTLAAVGDLGPFASAAAAALRKNGTLILYDWHPVSLCVEPVGLRWRENYFAEGFLRLGQVVTAVAHTGLTLQELEELPPPPSEAGGRLDPRVPTELLLVATRSMWPRGRMTPTQPLPAMRAREQSPLRRPRNAPATEPGESHGGPCDMKRSRMNPWRAALTSATASGNRTRMASRRAIACSSGPPLASTRLSAAAVNSTAVLRVNVANCSRCASATDSACCSANSRRPRINSSGSPPKGKLKPPSMPSG